jgi:signal transduction histidine kinase
MEDIQFTEKNVLDNMLFIDTLPTENASEMLKTYRHEFGGAANRNLGMLQYILSELKENNAVKEYAQAELLNHMLNASHERHSDILNAVRRKKVYEGTPFSNLSESLRTYIKDEIQDMPNFILGKAAGIINTLELIVKSYRPLSESIKNNPQIDPDLKTNFQTMDYLTEQFISMFNSNYAPGEITRDKYYVKDQVMTEFTRQQHITDRKIPKLQKPFLPELVLPYNLSGLVISPILHNAYNYAGNPKNDVHNRLAKPDTNLIIKIDHNIDSKNKKVFLYIKDNGFGITPGKILFVEGEKNGRGLSYAQSLMEANGGEIHCISQKGLGMEFIIQVPYDRIEDGVYIKDKK